MAVAVGIATLLLGGVGAALLFGPLRAGPRPIVTGASQEWRLLGQRVGAIGPALWSGKEVLFENKAFNPTTGRWRDLPAAPDDHRAYSTVWTGEEMIAWGNGGAIAATNDAAAFNPGTNAWRLLKPSPLAGQASRAAVWTGKVMIALASISPGQQSPLDAAVYDPVGDAWRSIPGPPFACLDGPLAVWTGGQAIVPCDSAAWGGEVFPVTSAQDGALYTPSSS